MVIHNFNVSGFIFDPLEANSPLIVYANAVLSCAISFEPLKPVSRRSHQILQIFSVIKVEQFASSSALDIPWQLRRNNAKVNLPLFF